MKIADLTYPKPIQQPENRPESTAGVRGKAGSAQPLSRGDIVQLSTTLDGASTRQQEEAQADRVASIKAQIREGSYRVASRLVAEKMLSAAAGI